jgi:AraC family transcriptional regulator
MVVARARKDPVGRALWYIETHFAEEIALDEIAAVSGVSPFHLSRVFGVTAGVPLMQYVRGRRLSEAAQILANGAPDILTVALGAGYGSHEAFTRAFRDRFGLTPETVREQRHVNNIELTEALRVDTKSTSDVQPPRIEQVELLLVAGFAERYSFDSIAGIPAQWQRFVPHIESLPARVGNATYGVCTSTGSPGNFEYLCGVEVRNFDGVPSDWGRVRIAGQRYAVFVHRDHISAIKDTNISIWNRWLPASGYEAADAPDFERYDENFDPRTGFGGVEIWIPIKP